MEKQTRLYDGDTFDYRGHSFRVTFTPDQDIREPWTEFDGHGVVSEWTRRDKAPGEKILCQDRQSRRYYDVQASMKLALKDGWGPLHCKVCGEEAGGIGSSLYGTVHKFGPRDHGPFQPESKRAQAAKAVEADYERLRRYCAGDWGYVSACVTLLDDDGDDTDTREYLGGVESDSAEYLADVAYELADQIIATIEVDSPDVVLSEN